MTSVAGGRKCLHMAAHIKSSNCLLSDGVYHLILSRLKCHNNATQHVPCPAVRLCGLFLTSTCSSTQPPEPALKEEVIMISEQKVQSTLVEKNQFLSGLPVLAKTQACSMDALSCKLVSLELDQGFSGHQCGKHDFNSF